MVVMVVVVVVVASATVIRLKAARCALSSWHRGFRFSAICVQEKLAANCSMVEGIKLLRSGAKVCELVEEFFLKRSAPGADVIIISTCVAPRARPLTHTEGLPRAHAARP